MTSGAAENPKLIQARKEGKTPYEYMPFGPLAQVARALENGGSKYGRFNWRIDRIKASTYVAAIARHAFEEWASGVDGDEDSGLHPLAHVAACCLIVLDAIDKGTLIDDRDFAESFSQMAAEDEAWDGE